MGCPNWSGQFSIAVQPQMAIDRANYYKRSTTQETPQMTTPSLPFRPLALTSAVAIALLQMSGQAVAQAAPAEPAAEPTQTVVVTGSLIRRAADAGALPVTTIKATELERRGHTELKDLILEMPQSLSLGTNSGAAGPVTNLRGLG